MVTVYRAALVPSVRDHVNVTSGNQSTCPRVVCEARVDHVRDDTWSSNTRDQKRGADALRSALPFQREDTFSSITLMAPATSSFHLPSVHVLCCCALMSCSAIVL
mmetsp:Transcript_60556/g.91353  ORF Transcript_60556/g.91353 Transcript_60556/m.91353 type:complete len:105 (+) Transcript_60556:399-713(+)